MATEPDDIVVEAGIPANDDRSVELVPGHRSQFEAKQSIAQAVKKASGDCRMVVEFPFNFTKQFLKDRSEEHGRHFTDGVDYLRILKWQFEEGEIDLDYLEEMSLSYGHNGIRIDAAK